MPVKNSKSIRPLGPSPKELLDTVDDLKARDVNLISLEERIATTSVSGELAFHRQLLASNPKKKVLPIVKLRVMSPIVAYCR